MISADSYLLGLPRVHACDKTENYEALKEEFSSRVYTDGPIVEHIQLNLDRAIYTYYPMAILFPDLVIGSCTA